MQKNSDFVSKSWLAFELNVLRRLKFESIGLPFTEEPNLGIYLKHSNVKIMANDFLPSAYAKSLAQIQNNSENLTEEDISTILEDVYVPHYKLQNEGLREWFSETDAWWFDNLRQNIETISSPALKAITLNIGLNVGDYVFSFTEDTRELRQPLSSAFRRFHSVHPAAFNNGKNNNCTNKTAKDFAAENHADLLFLRLPQVRNRNLRTALGWTAWREEWVRGGNYFWDEMEEKQTGNLGANVETKSQYLRLFEDFLKTASNIKTWAIAHAEDGFITTQDIAETISQTRTVDTIYTKDFTELMGVKAVIITA